MGDDDRKFRLSLRPQEPVLDYALWGYWTTTDAHAWKEAIALEIARRPRDGPWFDDASA